MRAHRSPSSAASPSHRRQRRRELGRVRAGLTSVSAILMITGLVVIFAMVGRAPAAYAAQPAVGLGTATSFAVLAGTTVTNTGPSSVSGDVGVSPGSAVTGFPPGIVTSGVIHAADAVALQAQQDLTTAYNDAAGRTPVVDKTDDDLGGETLVPGVYRAATSMALTGTVTLDAGGDPQAVFIFKAGSTLLTATGSRVALQNGAQACNVFWQVGSSATIGTTTTFVGTVLALASITVETGATVQGRVLARTGQVSLDTNTITRPTCSTATPPTSDGPSSTLTPTDTGGPSSTLTPTDTGGPSSTLTPTDTGSPSSTLTPTNPSVPTNPTSPTFPAAPDSPAGPGTPTTAVAPPGGGGPGSPPWVPTGHPPTGQVPSTPVASNGGWWLGGGLLALGAAFGVGGARASRPVRSA